MPIRFRCAYCSQLMGIGRRKAGSVVRCPKCQGQVVVPAPEADDSDDADQTAADKQIHLLEEGDFNDVLRPAGPGMTSPSSVPAVLPPSPSPPAVLATPGSVGIFLTPGLLALLCVIVILLVGMAFFLGFLLGRS